MARRTDAGWQPVRADGLRLYRHTTGVQVWLPVNNRFEPVLYRWEWLADLRAAVARV